MNVFASLGICEEIVRSVTELGFTEPTPVQIQVIPQVIQEGTDMVVLAQTGTGKTAAFGIPLLQASNAGLHKPQALVLCPTRELCLQVARDLTNFARFLPEIKTVPVYGGAPIDVQIKAIARGAQIIIATPGRLNDLIRRRAVDLSQLHTVVLDEADEMLQMGFQEELNAILNATPATKTTMLFSATMPRDVAQIAARYMRTPKEITVGRRNGGAATVRHLYFMVQARDRYKALCRIADNTPSLYAIIFCRTRQETQDVASWLHRDGFRADALHGDLSQAQRDQVMKKFRNRDLEILVATDVAARGLDVTDLTHVINYNLPDSVANYTHRSGRTGRAGKEGVSIALIHMRETHHIRAIEKQLQIRFEKAMVPTGNEVCRKRLLHTIDTVLDSGPDHGALTPFLPEIAERLADLDREELIARFVSLAGGAILAKYRNAPDLNVSVDHKTQPAKTGARPERNSGPRRFTRFFLNVGTKDGIHAKRLIGQLNEATGLPHIQFGKIELTAHTCMLEADSQSSHRIEHAFRLIMVNGRKVLAETQGERVDTGFRGKNPGRPGRGQVRKPASPARKSASPGYKGRKPAPTDRNRRQKP